jgi:hypothetical protein
MLLIAQCLVAESIVEGEEEEEEAGKGRRGAATAIKAGCRRVEEGGGQKNV